MNGTTGHANAKVTFLDPGRLPYPLWDRWRYRARHYRIESRYYIVAPIQRRNVSPSVVSPIAIAHFLQRLGRFESKIHRLESRRSSRP